MGMCQFSYKAFGNIDNLISAAFFLPLDFIGPSLPFFFFLSFWELLIQQLSQATLMDWVFIIG